MWKNIPILRKCTLNYLFKGKEPWWICFTLKSYRKKPKKIYVRVYTERYLEQMMKQIGSNFHKRSIWGKGIWVFLYYSYSSILRKLEIISKWKLLYMHCHIVEKFICPAFPQTPRRVHSYAPLPRSLLLTCSGTCGCLFPRSLVGWHT